MNILELFDRLHISYTRKGSSYVMRCPFCKNDENLNKHNVEINIDTNGFYCFSESKFYTYKEILQGLKSLNYNIDHYNFDENIKKRKDTAKENTEKTKSPPPVDFEIIKKNLEKNGYNITAVYEFYKTSGELTYIKYRFEKENEVGEKEKTFIYKNIEGKATLKNKLGEKQILYGLEQFAYIDPCEIYLVEGEKCRDAIISSMSNSTEDIVCLSFNKPSDFEGFENLFKNKSIVIFEDNDPTGKKNTKEIVELLKKYAQTIKVVSFVEFSQGFDVADFLEKNSWNELAEEIKNAEIVYKNPALQINIGVINNMDVKNNFILEPYIPKQSIVLFDGLGETGKSLLAMQLGLCLTTGKPFLGFEVKESQKILYFTAEETNDNFNDRLKKLAKGLNIKENDLINFAWLSIYSQNFQCSTYRLLHTIKGGVEKTEFYEYLVNIIAHFNPSLIVLDSLVNFYGLDENNSEHASIFLETLKMISKEYNCSFLLLHHQTKEAMRVGGEKLFRGSMVFREQSRARITLQRIKGNVKKLEIEKLNYFSKFKKDIYLSLAVVNENIENALCFIETEPPEKETITDTKVISITNTNKEPRL